MRIILFFLFGVLSFSVNAISTETQNEPVGTTQEGAVSSSVIEDAAASTKSGEATQVIQEEQGAKIPAAEKNVTVPEELPQNENVKEQEEPVSDGASVVIQEEKEAKTSTVEKVVTPPEKLPKKPVEKKQVKTGQEKIYQYISNLHEINKKIAGIEDESSINRLLEEQDRLVNDLLVLLRKTDVSRLPAIVDKKQRNFRVSRMEINEERGNQLAVKRDQAKLAYYKTAEGIRDYLQYLIQASRSYESVDEVVDYSVNIINEVRQDEKKITLPEQEVESVIYDELKRNYLEFQFASETFQDVLNFVVNNPSEIAKVHWFQKFSLISTISFFNNLSIIKPINYKLAPFNIDVGGIIVSFVIIILIIFCYPLVVRGSSWIIEKYVLDEESDHSEMIVQSLNRPIRYLLLFFSIDLATYALLYKTEYKTSLEDFVFVVYAWLFIWLLYRVMDSIFYVQIDKIARTNKALRKELIQLGVQCIKFVVFVVALSIVLNRFGISITAIMSTLGIGGLAFALAAKDSLSNLFGGVTILFDNVYRMGDWVSIGDVEGTIVEIGLRSTTIRTFDNALITIPNASVSVSSVKNWNRRAVGRRIKMHVGVTYESKMDDIRRALEDIRTMLIEHPNIANPKEIHADRKRQLKLSSREDAHGIKTTQLVFLDRYNDYSIDILIYCFSKTVNWSEWLAVKEDVLFKIAEILNKNNLEFAYPTEVRLNRQMPDDADMTDNLIGQ